MKRIDPRTGMEHLDRDDCLSLLAQHQRGVGRLAVVEGAKPTILVVNYAMVEDRIVFRTGPGTKLDAACNGAYVAFEIDRVDHDTMSGWSVVVRGRSEVVTGTSQLFLLRSTGLVPYADGGKDTWVMIHPDVVTGRMVSTGTGFVL